jgi:hypothetical protein
VSEHRSTRGRRSRRSSPKLILLLAERDRLMLLPDVVRTYRDRLMDHQQVIRGEVTTAMPIDADKVRALEQGFAKATGRRVVPRGEGRSVDHRRRGDAAGQHRLRRERHDTTPENEAVLD